MSIFLTNAIKENGNKKWGDSQLPSAVVPSYSIKHYFSVAVKGFVDVNKVHDYLTLKEIILDK